MASHRQERQVMPTFNQADALNDLAKKRKKDQIAKFEKVVMAESDAQRIILWAELPETRIIRENFKVAEDRMLKVLKDNKWTEAEGRGLCYALNYVGILEELIRSANRLFAKTQTYKQKLKESGE